MKTFWIRTASAVVYALLFLGTMYSGLILGNTTLGTILFTAFLLFVTIGCTFEFFRMVKRQGGAPLEVLGYIYAICTLLALTLPSLMGAKSGFTMAITSFTLFPCLFGITAICQLWRNSEQPFREVAYTMVPMFYVALPLALMVAILGDKGPNVLMMIVALVWVNDSAAYMGGSWFGKHKMWPRHSPGKTWEGTVIGVVVTILLAIFVGPLFNNTIAWYHWAMLGVICSVIDTLGDLVESMLKRSVGLNDSGNIMPGHGGFLDRFDSLLIITPFAFVYLIIFAAL